MSSTTDFPLRAYFGHHKCATGWTVTILREICFHMGIHFKIVNRPVDFESYGSLTNLVDAEKVDFLAYSNAMAEHTEDLPLKKGFHVVRDPRDVLVSAYFSHRHSHPITDNWPDLAEHRKKLQALSKSEGLQCEMEFSQQVFEDMNRWDYEQDHILELKMEELTADPLRGFVQIARFLGILDNTPRNGIQRAAQTAQMRMNRWNQKGRRFMPGNLPMFPFPRQRFHHIPRREVERIVTKHSFSNMTDGRKRGQEDRTSHYRKGVPGDWKNHFNNEHVRLFKKRYNDLLVKLGYESSEDWP